MKSVLRVTFAKASDLFQVSCCTSLQFFSSCDKMANTALLSAGHEFLA